ncbi:hypothetical protein SAMN06298216_0795 [Spirosomataceae bacterium TFI 002]|nr:hypothetical protein SAMN06298216_0795 [Spirosomataceae bacterium TFI 002]
METPKLIDFEFYKIHTFLQSLNVEVILNIQDG